MKFGGTPNRPARYFIGSADLWQRNLDRRIEVVTPVEAPDLMDRLEGVLETNLADDTQAWELRAEGTWERVPTGAGVNTFRALQEAALERARRRRDPDSLVRFPR